jgi:DNA-binding MarR family transcriptional regulator
VTPAPDAPVERWPLSRLLITASRLVEHDIAVQLRPYNLTHASFGVLAIVQAAPTSQRELAHATRVEEQTISQTVDRLERMGMVTRERDPADRRRFLVTVTGVGRRAFRHATRKDRAEQALAGLPEAEHLRQSLAELIRRMGGEAYVPAEEAQT